MLYPNIMNYEQDIKTLLTIGENIVIEFKRAGNGPEHDTYESICAFLNANKAINPGVITLSNLKPYSKNPIIANFFHQIGRADELGSGVRNLYHYVKLYSGAEPIFDEEDVFRLTVPLNAEYSPEKGDDASTGKTTPKTTPKTTLKTTLKGAAQKLAVAIMENQNVTISQLMAITGLSRDGVNYQLRALKKTAGLMRVGGRKSGHWEFANPPEKEASK